MNDSKVQTLLHAINKNNKGEAEDLVFADGTAGSSNQSFTSVDRSIYRWVALQFIGTSLSAADGVIKLQDSIDGTNFNDISGATITVASGTSSNMIRYTAFTGRYIKAVWTKNSNASGTISASFLYKS